MQGFIRRGTIALTRRYMPFWAGVVLRHHRPVIVGVTGTVGKTTTKEMIAAVLMHPEARQYVGTVGKSPASKNTYTGLPLSVLLTKEHPITTREYIWWLVRTPVRALRVMLAPYPDLMVLEFAIARPGTIRRLASIAQPTVAVVTAIGPAHLDTFETVERIAEEKEALIHNVPTSGLVILGSHNRYSAAMGSATRAPVVYAAGRGRELAENAARAVGRYFGLPDELIERALQAAGPVAGRQSVTRLTLSGVGEITLIDDSYNASPLSMELGLDLLAARSDEGRRVAVLGAMAELGEKSDGYHADIGTYARSRVDLLVGVGASARHYRPDYWYDTSAECAAQLPSYLEEGDVVWVKGSHVSRMRSVVATLMTSAEAAPMEQAVGQPVT